MKRVVIVACAVTTVILVGLIIYRIATRKEFQPTQHHMELAAQISDSFAQVKTHPLDMSSFSQAVHDLAGTNLDVLSNDERVKLYACINRFYACYSTGSFSDFKQLRLHPPFMLSKGLVSAVKNIADSRGIELKSDEDILKIAWDKYNGANRIGEANEESMKLAVTDRHDMGEALRHPSPSSRWPELATAMCWEGAVVYEPTPNDLLKKEGGLRFFAFEMFVRFSPHVDGPATPLVLVGYWDSTRADWMPYALCSMLHAGDYDTIF